MSYFAEIILKDKYGAYLQSDAMKNLKTTEPFRIVGSSYESVIDSNFWTLATSGAGASGNMASCVLTLASGTANNGSSKITSSQIGRFIFGHQNLFRAGIRFPALAVALNTRYFGPVTVSGTTPQNGFYFSLSPAGVLSVNVVNGGSVTSVASGSFNGSVSSFTMDTNVHFYEILYFTASVQFFVDGVLLHTITPTTAALTGSMHLPITILSVNSASGVTSGTIECYNSTIIRLGRPLSDVRSFNIAGASTVILKSGPGTLQRVTINANSGSSITIYDNVTASGTKLATIVPNQICTLEYNAPTQVGLTVVTVGAGCDITVSYE